VDSAVCHYARHAHRAQPVDLRSAVASSIISPTFAAVRLPEFRTAAPLAMNPSPLESQLLSEEFVAL